MDKQLLGSKISFSAYKSNHPLLHVFPLKGEILKSVTLSGERWLLVGLLKSFALNEMNIGYVLIKSASRSAIQLNKENQLVHFKPVPDIEWLNTADNLDAFLDEFWALAK